MKLILTGGGTLGSVSPLIGVWQELKRQTEVETLFVGGKKGPEAGLIKSYGFSFKTISAGKLRRYFSLKNFSDICLFVLGFFQSVKILKEFRPEIIISAGSYVAVPLIWASCFFKTKVVIYQPDLKVGLANRLSKKLAAWIFVSFPETAKHFPPKKTAVVGTVLRQEIGQPFVQPANKRPLLLFLGGGTGSATINRLAAQALPGLKDYDIFHLTGQNKNQPAGGINYGSAEFLASGYEQKLLQADLVISRAGFSTLMELSFLAKPAVLIPLPNSPQEQNAEYFCRRQAAVCLEQKSLTVAKLIETIGSALEQSRSLSKNIHKIFSHDGAHLISQKILTLNNHESK
ncbi:MAG: UDP-diphospho-muramoylpentapeptide beta-N- acetylglucosaminyltransferase [Parcubacteria group bacterium GW2011_GWA2_43_17]|nr:MAG: UDP-diphospho-muramoylpentapeptide beta-N- acetylglucosaminyltransferase [Parcubacteria group bacterium GW2011_GWA2_43_17]KKT94470.1 MAG: UDP-diphospho-muramoylpentapeptide beta-N- acetylglucosaminyltransferase [Parcubacteria group bacterium GW2011_GWF2_45_11]OGY93788.1 MAG: hypothetical protein A3J95_01845 [Candidatus Komeilibacteria bacterium RIFOXYC2_FULL_45_12]HAH04524.1 hypothetical protein [Candidatus Komeilibacteria bacterium]HBR13168.1 hypothetical protein [Candidatus Komeilibac